jgi:hypothetical protein
MSFKILTLNDEQEWNSNLASLPVEQQDVYFTPEYYRLYENYGDGKACCFVFEYDGEIALYPFLMNTVNELGYNLNQQYYDIQGAYGYNGVVSSSYDVFFIEQFYAALRSFCVENKIIAEFTRFHPLLNNKSFSEKEMTIFFDRKTMYIDLSDTYELIFNRFQTSTRKQIKRCDHKYGLTVKIFEKDNTQLPVFYKIYTEAMDRVKSVSYLYFNEEYFQSLLETDSTALFIAYYEGEPIAAITAMYNSSYIHGHLGGALTDYLHTSAYALLYAEMIKFGIDRGCKYFHAGGGVTSNPDDKLLKYKLNFSHTTTDFYIGKKVHNQSVYNEVIKQWKEKYPEKEEKYKNMILKYRY